MKADERDYRLAHFYDLEYTGYDDDLDFYTQLARSVGLQKGSGVLEFGCGTGRVVLRLAQQGYRVTGADQSSGMLRLCGERASEMGQASRVTLVEADMARPGKQAGAPFELAICALNTFAYLLTTAEQKGMLRSAHSNLSPDGVLVLDLTPPYEHLLPPSGGEVIFQGSYADPQSGGVLYKSVTGQARPAQQAHDVSIFYDLVGPEGDMSRMLQQTTFRWTGRFEAQLLLESCGFSVQAVYGGYELEDFTAGSERMIFVARRSR